MKPRPKQIEKAAAGYKVLRDNGLVYFAMEERTGKTLSSILTCEACKNVKEVLVITKKKAKEGWDDTVLKYDTDLNITVTTYHQAHKIKGKYDIAILDEPHSYLGSFPKPGKIWKVVFNLVYGLPIIFTSATPHAQGYHTLYHQLKLSKWSPWNKYSNFYNWFKAYGIPKQIYINGRYVNQYTNTQEKLCEATTKDLFVVGTRKEMGFEVEPEDKLHYVELTAETRRWYNELMNESYLLLDNKEIVTDTPMKLRSTLHMLEGGGYKVDGKCYIAGNKEKITYIKAIWGDSEDVVIFYNYHSDKLVLEQHFSKARILQGESYAEGVDLSMYKHLIVYSMNFKTSMHSQRRARQANFNRKDEILVNFILVKNAISEQVYETVAKNKKNFVDALFERNEL